MRSRSNFRCVSVPQNIVRDAWYNSHMTEISVSQATRRPRFRRASEPPAFRLTEDDVAIVRLLARHRFLRSNHIAILVGRSTERTNFRLSRLFHAGYVDRPRAQLDYYPTAGSAPIAYALADRGARLLIHRDGIDFANVEWSRKNRRAGRPFIEHQLEIMDFYVALQRAARERSDIRIIEPSELAASFPDQRVEVRNPFSLRARLSHSGVLHDVAVVPDLAFGLMFPNGSRKCFMVEIDRGTMPVVRSDLAQTSFERKMRAYLTTYATKQHERHFGWKAFRVLTVTTDAVRQRSIAEVLGKIRIAHSPGASLFYFLTRDQLRDFDPLAQDWKDGAGRNVRLI